MALKLFFRALKHKNYRWFFLGQGISLVGTWMQSVALSWLIYRLTGSAFMLGITGFFGQIPTFFVSPFAGVAADRYNRRLLLIVTQSLAMLQAVVLSCLVLSGMIMPWHIILLSVVSGLVNSFDIPVRQAFVLEMVGKKEDLANAIALNSSLVNVTRLLGPSLAGVIIALWGEGVCFLFNAASYVPLIIFLTGMPLGVQRIRRQGSRVWDEFKEGFVYALSSVPMRFILMLLGFVFFMAVSYQVLLPVYARDIFHGNAATLGFLTAMAGAGALTGSLYIASKIRVERMVRYSVYAAALFGVGLLGFSLSRIFWVSLFMLFLCGFSLMVQMAASNTILQHLAPEDKRGRVMSLYTMAFMGTAPFGSLVCGLLANKIGAPLTLFFSGSACLVVALFFARRVPRIQEELKRVFKNDVDAAAVRI